MSVEWLFPNTRWVILTSLFAHPEKDCQVRELIRIAGGSSAHIQRELRQFAAAGLLTRMEVGNQVRYRANSKHPLYPELRSIVLKTVGLVDVIREALRNLDGIRVAFVFGSFASGSDRADSDVDLAVIGRLKSVDVVASLGEARDKLGRDVNPTVYRPDEFGRKVAAGNPFLSRVLEGPKLFVIGTEDELDRLGR